jgi:hypothetical protein
MSGTAEVEEPAILAAYGDALAEAHAGPRDQIGERLVRTFLRFWEDPQLRPQLLTVFRSATVSEEGAAQMRAFVTSQLFTQVAEMLDVPPMSLDQMAETLGVPPVHLNAAAAQVVGVIMLRYVLQTEPIASVSPEELVQVLAPTIQRYLGG